jgi:hypothetical protein
VSHLGYLDAIEPAHAGIADMTDGQPPILAGPRSAPRQGKKHLIDEGLVAVAGIFTRDDCGRCGDDWACLRHTLTITELCEGGLDRRCDAIGNVRCGDRAAGRMSRNASDAVLA